MATEIKTKRYIINSVNGTDELFQLPEEYIEDSLWTFVVAASGASSIRQNTYFAGGFFQITPAPTAGSKIYAIYNVEETTPNDPANFSVDGITISNIVEMLDIIRTQGTTLAAMDLAIQNRVSINAFSQFAEELNRKVRALEVPG